MHVKMALTDQGSFVRAAILALQELAAGLPAMVMLAGKLFSTN
jgi:hypothetical protein